MACTPLAASQQSPASRARARQQHKGTAPRRSAATDTASDLLDLARAHVRDFAASPKMSTSLAAIGAALLVLGSAWGCWRVLQAHPCLICIASGLALLLAAALSSPRGLLVCLPKAVQDLLLEGTLFDMLYDDTAGQNFIRRWGRVLLLFALGERSEAEVEAILEGIDPTFVDAVLRRRLIDWLPSAVRSLLVRAPPSPVAAAPVVAPAATLPLPPGARGLGCAGGAPAARVKPQHTGEEVAQRQATPLSAREIVRLLRAKHQAKQARLTEPALIPVAVSVLGLRPAMRAAGLAALRGLKVAFAFAALGLGLSGIALQLGALPRGYLLRLVALGSAALGRDREATGQLSAKAFKGVSWLAVLGAGAAIAAAGCAHLAAGWWEQMAGLSSGGEGRLTDEGAAARPRGLPAPAAEGTAAAAVRQEDADPSRVAGLEAELLQQEQQHSAEVRARIQEYERRLQESEARELELSQRLERLLCGRPSLANGAALKLSPRT